MDATIIPYILSQTMHRKKRIHARNEFQIKIYLIAKKSEISMDREGKYPLRIDPFPFLFNDGL